ncbi:MAG: hypothetical protein NUV68_03885 [Caldiserica bacterium]|jgi:hypothetical protein|nr:hypothetical protein [Caldisericota bacterium]MDH7562317.1 hypothetical protein [Caldisericota bacterium]
MGTRKIDQESGREKLLETLKRFRRVILACESACLLHDLGKLSSHFIKAKSSDFKETDRHAGVLEWQGEPVPENLSSFLNAPVTKLWPAKEGRPPRFLKGVCFSHFLSAHHGFERMNNSSEIVEFVKFLQACDRKSSAEDKANPSDQAKQPYLSTFKSTVLGIEEFLDPPKLDQLRFDFWKKMGEINFLNPVSARRRLLPLLWQYFSWGLAETRRSANDLNLFHHSYSVATYLKIGLTSFLLEKKLPQDLEDIQQAVLIVEVKGNPEVNDLKKLRYLIEEKFPCGNFFFQSYNHYYFLVPKAVIPLKEDLARESESYLRRRVSFQCFPLSGEGWEVPQLKKRFFVPRGELGVVLGLEDFIREDLFDTLFSKRLECIEEGLTFQGLVQRTKRVLALAKWEKAQELQAEIKSLSRHLKNLEKGLHLGKLTPLKQKEYLIKRKKLHLLKRELEVLKRGKDFRKLFKSQEEWEEFRQRTLLFVDRVFSWLHPPDPVQVSRTWEGRGAPAQIALRYILRKGPSFSRLYAMMEECQKFMSQLSGRIGRPSSFSPTFATFRTSPEKISRESREIYERIFGKFKGRIPLLILPPGKYPDPIFEIQAKELSAVRRKKGRVFLKFTSGENWELPGTLGNGEEDDYYLLFGVRNRSPKGTRRGLVLPGKSLIPAHRLRKGDFVEVLAPKNKSLL